MPADAPALPNYEQNNQKLRAPKFPPISVPGRIDSPFLGLRLEGAGP
jgi:hypothetical protein